MAITRLSGGTTPPNGSDPRTFPAIWNDAVDDIEAAEADITTLEGDVSTLEGDVSTLESGKANIINTDSNAGKTIYVGSVDPNVSHTLVAGDVWIEVPE